ncbi:LysE family translocator [Frigidibacter sp. MR17.24]|uniref:LysE family translocator n=1 Tax=Frigidibacter sp. MR17.24 TaxID=3127345 RepID=UPI0030131DC9
MTLSAEGLWLYAGALLILWLTPGPVFVAMIARGLTGGFAGVWPLAVGVALGDLMWSLLAIFGLSVVAGQQAEILHVLRWVAAVIFLVMGAGLIRNAGKPLSTDGRMTRPGLWGGFSAGILAILGNPKAILFYMGVLPGFFDLSHVTGADIVAIVVLSMAIPLAGNLVTAAAVGRARAVLSTPGALKWTNRTAGGLLVAVGCVIGFL